MLVGTTQTLSVAGKIFGTETPGFTGDDENWTRAQIVAYAPEESDSVHNGIYGSLAVNQAGVWTYALANGQANVQALAQGDIVYDTFQVQVTDEHGATDTETVTIEVTGTNDAASMLGDTASTLTEDDTTAAIGTLTVTDPDHDESHTQIVTNGAGLAGLGTYSVDANGHWSYIVDNTLVQYLNADQFATDSFVVNSLDGTALETVTITITGEDDPPTFSRADYATGSGPLPIAIADLNGDNNLDLVIANGNSFSTDSILLGNGDGTFQGQTTVFVGESHDVLIADLNGDGKSDLINANSNSGTISVSLGNGDGTFQSRTTYGNGGPPGPGAIAIGDLNGDGNLDIVSDRASGVAVLLGNADGTFQAATQYADGLVSTADAQVGDLNGDNYLDIVASGSSAVSVLLGNGDGSFQAATTFAAGGTANAAELADLNGDNSLDIVVANNSSDSVSVLLGNGDGTFQAHIEYPTGPTPYDLAIGDLNGDGNLDMVTTSLFSQQTLSVSLGNGDGTFQDQIQYATGVGPAYVSIEDLNGDNKNDIIVTNAGDNTVSVFLNTSDWMM